MRLGNTDQGTGLEGDRYVVGLLAEPLRDEVHRDGPGAEVNRPAVLLL